MVCRLSGLDDHPSNGQEEMKAENNHGTCLVMQVAAFASFTGDQDDWPSAASGSKKCCSPSKWPPMEVFPQELRRTKPYGYSLFNADAMATVCQILSTPQDNLWEFTTEDGRNMRKAVEYILSVHQGQIDLAAQARRDVLGILAGALADSVVRRAGVSRAEGIWRRGKRWKRIRRTKK